MTLSPPAPVPGLAPPLTGDDHDGSQPSASDRLPAERSLPASTVTFYGVLLFGFVIRLVLIATPLYQFDSDRAVVYLMARHVADGQFTALYWGQSYGGTLLPILAGVAMLITGAHAATLTVVSALIWAAAAWFVRATARELIGPLAGDIAGVIVWLPGVGMVTSSLLDPGFYGPMLALSFATIWLVVRGAQRKPIWMWLLIGVLSGLAFWQAIGGAALVAPFLAWQLWRQRSWRHWLTGAAGIVIGALPWLLSILRMPGGDVIPHTATATPITRSAVTLFTHLLPAAFLPQPTDGPTPYRWAVALVVLGLLAVFLVAAAARKDAASVLLIVSAALIAAVTIAGAGVPLMADSARYAAFLYPSVAISAAWLLTRWRPGAVVAVAISVAITVFPIAAAVRADAGAGDTRWGQDAADVATYLHAHQLTAGYADYWLAYRVTAAADERIVLAGLTNDRYAPYAQRAATSGQTVVIVQAGQPNDVTLTALLHGRSQRTIIDGWAVYAVPAGEVRPAERSWALF